MQPPPSAPTLRRWTRAEYDRMIEAGILGPSDHCELLEGEIVTQMPQGSRHSAIAGHLGDTLRAFYRTQECVIRVQMPLALGGRSEPEPDLAVVRGAHMDYLDEHPTTALLVVEVSDTSLEYDRTRKRRVYARAGIPEYWIVNLAEERVEVHRAPSGEDYDDEETLRPPAPITPPETDDDVPVADLLP
jgi:Uma2 family endonuclease